MARLVFALIVFMHGLIHVLGFVKEWHLARVDQLTGKTLVPLGPGVGKAFGALGLFTCLAFLLAAAAFLMKKDWWWMVALGTLLASQLIVVIYWADAFAGT
ncbi:MAG: hypothetical protein IMZ69_05265, partial [Spirochaetes bacterium]|nr:hypothetical protein [Spirochaetota bacterium]